MSLSRGTSVGTPRVFVDYISYLRAVDAIDSYFGEVNVWDMNPSRTISLDANETPGVYFDIETDPDVSDLLGASNYLAVLGQDVAPENFHAVFGNEDATNLLSVVAKINLNQGF